MKRGGGFLFAAGCLFFLLSGISSPVHSGLQESETETHTSTVSDFFLPTSIGTETPTASVFLTPTAAKTGTYTPAITESPTETPVFTDTLTDSPTANESRTGTVTASVTDTPAATESRTGTVTVSVTDTPAATGSQTETITASVTDTPTPTNSPTVDSSPAWVVISEVAWAGTAASTSDEWMELWNPGAAPVDLSGWVLTDNGDIRISLTGTIGAGAFHLLERTDDATVASIPADQIYTGALSNSGEALFLIAPAGNVIDSANGDGGPWPAGMAVAFGSMERTGAGLDSDSSWCSNDGIHRGGSDAGGNPINGTPRQPFSGFCGEPSRTPTRTPTPTGSETVTATLTPTPTHTSTPGEPSLQSVIISEAAWAGTAASSADEWIELRNPGPAAVDLSGWVLTDGNDIQIALSGVIVEGGFFLLERTDDGTVSDIPADLIYTGALSNSGEVLRLIDSSGRMVDTANGDGGPWPAGASAPDALSMERISDGPDTDSSWCTNDGLHRNGRDASGNPILGTPRSPFSGYCGGPTPTLSATPTLLQIPFAPQSVVINEVAWAGTAADSSDEWIELWNPGTETISLSGWVLTDEGDMRVFLEGSIPAGGYFLLERGGDDTLSDIAANQIYSGGLSNSGEELLLLDPTGGVVDFAGGRPWPAGTAGPAYASMERAGVEPPFWSTNTGWVVNGRDAAGNPVRGTPGRANSALFPTPTSTALPKGILINEFLPKPGSDWNRDGSVDYYDEFIELLNTGPQAVDLGGWMLDDMLQRGSRPYVIPGGTWIESKEFLVFFRSRTRIALNDEGDDVWLLAPDGTRIDGRVYTRTRWPDSAWGRYPDGVNVLRLGFPPTPGEPNRLPDDILNPKKDPLPVIAEGWRRVICGPGAGPLLVGEGFLTTGNEESTRMAESQGWYIWWGGKCFAWSAPFAGRRLPYSNLVPDADSAQEGAGWWWEWWYLQ